jgi:hypothetical protein
VAYCGGVRDGNSSIFLRGLLILGTGQIGDFGLIHPKGKGRGYGHRYRNAAHDVMLIPQCISKASTGEGSGAQVGGTIGQVDSRQRF